MAFVLGSRSKQRLEGVHVDLVKVLNRAIRYTSVDFTVIEGLRSLERQKMLVDTGKSQTLRSRHLTGHAVDIAPWINNTVSWDFEDYYPIAEAMINSSIKLGIPLRWGGNWHVKDVRDWEYSARDMVADYPGSFYDLPHWELTWQDYPA